MKYFFILGNNPTLSIAELAAVFNLNEKIKESSELYLLPNVFILKTDKIIIPSELIRELGGIIKIGQVRSAVDKNDQAALFTEITKLLKPISGKFKFGISYYGKAKFNTKPLAMEIKKYLKEQNVSCRWVTSREKTLSSVVVEQNKLTSKGVEIVLVEKNEKILIGQTLAVQPFKELSFRDYGRPARDDLSGMLPPKLAQIMINLSQARSTDTILDPFCGSGTILTEAMLMGYKNLIGSDVSLKAVDDTKQNIIWIKKQYPISNIQYQLYNNNASQLSNIIKPQSINTIITEPYLGPPRGKFNIKKTVQALEQLYAKTLREFKKILVPNSKVIMVWPVFIKHGTRNFEQINPNLSDFKIINPIPKILLSSPLIKLTNRNTIIYGRPGQKIWREIVILQK